MKDIKLNFKLKDIPAKIFRRLQRFSRYGHIIFVVSALVAYSFLVWRINVLNQAKPSQDDLLEGLTTLRLPKIDEATIEKLEQLEDNSVEIRTLFQHARENPFQE